LQNWWFVSFGTIDFRAGFVTFAARLHRRRRSALAVDFHETTDFEFRLLQNLDFADVDVVQWVNTVARLLDILADTVRDQFVDHFAQIGRRDFARHNFDHLAADLTNLRVLSVRRLPLLIVMFLGESDAEQTEQKAIARFHVDVRFDQRLPFLHQRAQLSRVKLMPWKFVKQYLP